MRCGVVGIRVAWNGAKQERGAEKAVSTWYFLSLEQPTSAVAWVAPVAVVAGVFAAQMAGLRRLRERAARRSD